MPITKDKPPSPLGLTKLELARNLGVSKSTIESWVRHRAIPYFKIANGMLRFNQEEVLLALQKYKIPAAAPKLSASWR
jgi:excisionase family DNA binding protein